MEKIWNRSKWSNNKRRKRRNRRPFFGRKIQKYYREIEKELNIRKKDSVSSNELKEIINKIEETAENKRKNEIYKMIN